MKIRAFITHKQAEFYSDCQDRFSINSDTKSLALADGMSQSYQQKIWAKLLVESYTEHRDFVPIKESIKELSASWKEKVVAQIEQMKRENAPEYLIIRNENSIALHKSAGATFLGIRFNGNEWKGDVLGDSCLIEIKENKITRIHTSQSGDEFDNYPDYFDSDSGKDGKGSTKQINGSIDENTSVLMVSDPFSDFLNEKHKDDSEQEFVKQLLSLNSQDEFELLVDKWREVGMHNDDSTLIIIEHDGSDEFNISSQTEIEKLIDYEKREKEEEKKREEAEKAKQEELAKQEATKETAEENSENETPNQKPSQEQQQTETNSSGTISEEFIKFISDEFQKQLEQTNSNHWIKMLRNNFTKIKPVIVAVAKETYKQFNITKK